MTPKKAIIIILIMFFVVTIVFVVLYLNSKQPIGPTGGINTNQAEQTNPANNTEAAKPEEPNSVVEEKVNQIIEEAKTNPGSTQDTVRQEVISTINAEIIKQEENKTPEEKAADLKAKTERQRIIDEINNKIKQAQ